MFVTNSNTEFRKEVKDLLWSQGYVFRDTLNSSIAYDVFKFFYLKYILLHKNNFKLHHQKIDLDQLYEEICEFIHLNNIYTLNTSAFYEVICLLLRLKDI